MDEAETECLLLSITLFNRPHVLSFSVDDRATNSTAIEAIQTLLRVLCYLPAGSNEAIRGLCKTLAGLLLASAQHSLSFSAFHNFECVHTRYSTVTQTTSQFTIEMALAAGSYFRTVQSILQGMSPPTETLTYCQSGKILREH